MSNLESGKVYNIDIGWPLYEIDYQDVHEGASAYSNSTVKEYYEWIVKRFSNILNINLDYFDLTFVNANAYFNLPYIATPEENARLKVFLYYSDDETSDENTTIYNGTHSGWPDIKIFLAYVNNGIYSIKPEYYERIVNTTVYKLSSEDKTMIYYDGGWNPINGDGHLYSSSIQIDTRFLGTHSFYTLGYFSASFISGEVDNYFCSPSVFICDMKNSLTSRHSDALIFLPTDYDSYWDDSYKTNTLKDNLVIKKLLLDREYTKIITIIGLTKDTNGNYIYDIQNYVPQIFAKEGLYNFTIEKIHCGELFCSKELYIGRTGVILGERFVNFFKGVYSGVNPNDDIRESWLFDYFSYKGKNYSVGYPKVSYKDNFVPVIPNVLPNEKET